jgi:hypothetical protein
LQRRQGVERNWSAEIRPPQTPRSYSPSRFGAAGSTRRRHPQCINVVTVDDLQACVDGNGIDGYCTTE